jgi:hypothetical protein
MSINPKHILGYCFFRGEGVALEFELKASCLLDRHSYYLSHSILAQVIAILMQNVLEILLAIFQVITPFSMLINKIVYNIRNISEFSTHFVIYLVNIYFFPDFIYVLSEINIFL